MGNVVRCGAESRGMMVNGRGKEQVDGRLLGAGLETEGVGRERRGRTYCRRRETDRDREREHRE